MQIPPNATQTTIELRPASLHDREKIYDWLVKHLQELQNLQPNVRIPSWDEFVNDYHNHYFSDNNPIQGRSFLIFANEQEIGHICYHGVSLENLSAELDLWLQPGAVVQAPSCEAEAIQLLCNTLQQSFGCKVVILTPSRSNKRAISTYVRAGFILSNEADGLANNAQDAVILVKTIEH
jgi:RimJ/RimL family protein N-acetyltransferase